MRRLLPYLGFLPLLLVAMRLYAQESDVPGWDPIDTGPDDLTMILTVMTWSVVFGVVLGIAGPWRSHYYRLDAGRKSRLD